MNSLLIWTPLVAVAFIFLLWLMTSDRSRGTARAAQFDLAVEQLLPRHYRYFPQIRQALCAEDEQYLRERAAPDVLQRALRERRQVARRFLAALFEDFSNLERLARTVAALSPQVSRQQEFERLILGAKFRLLYAAVLVRLSVGTIPVQNLEHLTGLVGRLATRMEEAMASVSAFSQPGLTDHFTA